MSDFTEDQLKAMREGTTPAPWSEDVIYPDCSCIVDDTDGRDVSLAYTARALLDALIAEKQAHAELRNRIEDRIQELKRPLCSHMPEGDELDECLEQWGWQSYEAEVLTRILEADNE